IKLSAINKYPELLQSLVNNGINEIRQTQFLASNYDELHKKAQKMAIKQAKAAAKELIDDFDVELKGLYSASLTPLDMPST
ncbi:SIMPL domain-containing protein, partial [Pseudoalteromonas sp. 41-MNA-CIBAN-0057]